MPDVLVIGDALLDVGVAPARPPRPGTDVPAAIALRPGGQGANVAVRLARRGADVMLACALADDAGGLILRAALAAEGVKLQPIAADASGTVVVILDADGERTMLSQRVPLGAALATERLPAAGWVVVSGYVLLETDSEPLVRLLAHRSGRRMLVGCALEPEDAATWSRRAAALRPDLVVLSADEAAAMAAPGAGPGELAPRLGSGLVVVTHRRGARASIDGHELAVEAPAVAPGSAVDATGAGDAFAAALLAALLEAQWPPTSDALGAALGAAASAGAAAVRVRGAQGVIPGERAAGSL